MLHIATGILLIGNTLLSRPVKEGALLLLRSRMPISKRLPVPFANAPEIAREASNVNFRSGQDLAHRCTQDMGAGVEGSKPINIYFSKKPCLRLQK